ncbi:MAG: tetratricopeptide repeat protein [Leptospirillum sp.]
MLVSIIFYVVSLFLIPTRAEYVDLAISSGNYDYASQLLAPALIEKKIPVWALRDASRVAAFQGYPEKATRYLERLVAENPEEYQDRLELARLYLDQYQPGKAAVQLHILLQDEKLPLKDMVNLAKSYDLMDLPTAALEILHRLADSHSRDMDYWKTILIYDSQTGNIDDSARTLRKLTTKFPKRIDYLQLRMNLAYRRGRYAEAILMMDRLKSLHVGLDRSLMPAIRSLFHLNHPVDAYLLYRQASSNISDNSVLESAAWFFYQKKYEGYALSIFESLLMRDPKNKDTWDNAVWLADKRGWYQRTRMLMEERQKVLPLPEELFHVRMLDLDLRYHLDGLAQKDLLTWLSQSSGPSLSDLRLAWQNAENHKNLPLKGALLKQALSLNPQLDVLRSDLAENEVDQGDEQKAGGVILARGLATKNVEMIRRSIPYFRDADQTETLKGIFFRLASSDGRFDFRNDQFELFRLFEESPHKEGLKHLVAVLDRYPDLSGSMSMELAHILIWEKNYPLAQKSIDQVIATNPFNRALLFQASDWFIEADQLSMALVYDKKLVELLPSDPEGFALLVKHRIWSGDNRQLLVQYQHLLRLQPDNEKALLFLGNYAYDHGEFRLAIRYYRLATKAGALDYRIFYHMGQSFHELGDTRMARKMLRLSWQLLQKNLSGANRKKGEVGDPSIPDVFRLHISYPLLPLPQISKKKKEQLLYIIKIQSALGHEKTAYKEALFYLRLFPDDREGLYWAARLVSKLGSPGKGIFYLNKWLSKHPYDRDFLIYKGELLMKEGHLLASQKLFWHLYRNDPNNKVIWSDLVDSYRVQGALDNEESFDSHIFSQGETQAPRVTGGLLSLYDMNDWSLKNQNFAIFYPGGASYIFDTKIETPLYSDINYFAGRTEYLGVGLGAGWGTNDFSYAGIRWTPSPGWQITGEAGDTRLTGSPGFYVHLSGQQSSVAIDVQGFDDMIWGDFGQSIVRDGLQSGYMAQITWNATPRLSFVAESWLFDYTLENGTVPFGSLHNTMGMMDWVLDPFPQIDFLAGYEDWSMMSPSQSVAALVPILERQQFLFSALVFQHQIHNRLNFNAQVGGYEDIYSHIPSYEGGAGLSYRFSTHLEGFASGDYFNQSVLYNGASQEVVWGFNLWF